MGWYDIRFPQMNMLIYALYHFSIIRLLFMLLFTENDNWIFGNQ